MNDAQKKEFTYRITHANKTQMITILYDMTIKYLEDSINSIELGDYNAMSKDLKNGIKCIDELIRSVNLEIPLGRDFMQIYLFCKRNLIHAEVSKDKLLVEEVMSLFMKLEKAYLKLEVMDISKPVLRNSQDVYAGLTYGKNNLVETVTNPEANRGFMA